MNKSLDSDFNKRIIELLNSSFNRKSDKTADGTEADRDDSVEGEIPLPPEEIFFRKWFRESGNAFYFLFRKNLKVTNIQFAELLTLLQAHSTENGVPVKQLRFLSTMEFKIAIKNMVGAFNYDNELAGAYYSLLLERVAVLDNYFGSCVAYIPQHIEIDLKAICAYSGYIHSCGRMVFIRNIEKMDENYFYSELKSHLKRNEERYGKAQKPTLFVVYTHEDYTKHDRNREEYLHNGLDDVKLYLEKSYVGDKRLASVLADMRTDFKDELLIPDPGTSRDKFSELRGILKNKPDDPTAISVEEPKIEPSRTIWLLTDYSIGAHAKQRGEDRFYVCYEQEFLNENPLHIFDENKPAWLAPTTIPHTLLAAMINITGVSRRDSRGIVLADPFAGTGTTWLESSKLYPRMEPRCSDISSAAAVAAEDNLSFFSKSPEQLLELWKKLEQLESQTDPTAAFAAYLEGRKFLEQLNAAHNNDHDAQWSQEEVEKLKELSEDERLFFYLARRTDRIGIPDINHGSPWFEVYKKQAHRLANNIEQLINLKVRAARTGKTFDEDESFTILQGHYSDSCTISQDSFDKFQKDVSENKPGWPQIRVCDATEDVVESLEENRCDVIVTDPPYGFNTPEAPKLLAEIYTKVIEKMIKALKPEGGHLVLCLLDRSYTGRRSLFFTNKETVIQQVISVAQHLGREVFTRAYAVPNQTALFKPPYYWESEISLRRAILHFTIRDISYSGTSQNVESSTVNTENQNFS